MTSHSGAEQRKGEIFVDLLIAMLAVNQFSLEKAGTLLPGLREHGLTSYNAVASMAFDKIFEALIRSGYGRGNYIVSLLSERIQQTARAFADRALEHALQTHEDTRNIAGVREVLTGLRGVGPRVIENYLVLRGLA